MLKCIHTEIGTKSYPKYENLCLSKFTDQWQNDRSDDPSPNGRGTCLEMLKAHFCSLRYHRTRVQWIYFP